MTLSLIADRDRTYTSSAPKRPWAGLGSDDDATPDIPAPDGHQIARQG
ncbi:hypothetical protein [Azorhizobium doebereinerae]|nr:hypothetical protein [Azorhizobium doebereinerae]